LRLVDRENVCYSNGNQWYWRIFKQYARVPDIVMMFG